MAAKTLTPPSSGRGEPDWATIERSTAFRALIAAKMRFIVPATLFFVGYYFLLPVLVGYFPDLMNRNVVGNITVAYVFALSQFVMAWTVMGLYVVKAKRFDAQEKIVLDGVKGMRT